MNQAQNEMRTYHYVAENVHDFVWAADPEYKHDVISIREGLDIHLYYQADTLAAQWVNLEKYLRKAVPFIEEKCGEYPYPVYTIIQAGDGGMEYPMTTMLTGHRSMKSLVGVVVHEFLHSWFQTALATNESYNYWMDEGFNTYYDDWTMDYLYNENFVARQSLQRSYASYKYIVNAGIEEPLTTHADHYETNRAYGMAAYRKGSLVLQNLEYVIGTEVFDRAMLSYYNKWKFKHPNAIDFELLMEKESGLDLTWFFDYWIKSTKTIDYGVKTVRKNKGKTQLELEKIGDVPMPLDIEVTLKNGEKKQYYIPLGMMRGAKPLGENVVQMSAWKWVNPFYSFTIDVAKQSIKTIEIDPSHRMTDINRENNSYPNKDKEVEIMGKPQKMENIN